MNKKDSFESNICSKCGGKCCHEGLYVTKKEYENLSEENKKKFECTSFMNGYRAKTGSCSFLGDNGCTLPQEERFIECKLFPLEIAGLDKLIINKDALKDCIGIETFITDEHYKKCYNLLNEYQKKGLLTEEDVDSILNNDYTLLK